MPDLVNIWADSERDVVSDDTTPTLTLKNTSSGEALSLIGATGAALKAAAVNTGPALDVYVSSASGSVLKVNNIEQGYVSTNSTASMSFAMRVDIGGTIYYVPVYLGKA